MSVNPKSSAYEIIQSHGGDIKVRLYTPAHQGGIGKSQYFTESIFKYDFPFLTRNRTEGVERHFSQLYQTEHTFFLTSGATQGLLVACAILAQKHRKVALGLNSHAAVIHGLILTGLEPFFIPSKSFMPTADEVIHALESEGDIGALILTHPSYKGVVTDIQAVAEYCTQRQIQFVVDEAHGTHFPFLGSKFNSVLVTGGDLVLHSLHKYVGGFVQTALMHLPAGSSITVGEVKTALALFESTTRSNLLMLSIEESIQAAFTEEGQSLFVKAAQRADKLRQHIQSLGQALIVDSQVCDPFKFFLRSDRISGEEIGQLLNQYGIDYEYADEQGVLLIFSFQHTEFDFKYTEKVLTDIDQLIASKQPYIRGVDWDINRNPILKMLPKEAFFAQRKPLPIAQAKGEISATCFKKIPPGIPILIPGEEVTEWHLNQIAPETVIEVIVR